MYHVISVAAAYHFNTYLLTHSLITEPLEYMHFGEMVEGVVDQRGEVALLSRNIVIRGEMEDTCPSANKNCDTYSYDTFGGHVKVIY